MFFVVLLVVPLLAGQTLGLITTPAAPEQSQAANQITAAETLLSKTGTIGTWAFREPPGYVPVKCTYPQVTDQFRGIDVPMPVVFPVTGVPFQNVKLIPKLYQRLPDGSRVFLTEMGSASGTTSVATPLSIINFGTGVDLGSTIVATVEIMWFDGSMNVQGSVVLLYNQYQTTRLGPPDVALRVTDACYPALPALASLDISQGTVNQSIPFTIHRFPQNPAVTIYFDGQQIGSVGTNHYGTGVGSFTVPAAPKGQHTVKFYRFGRQASDTFTIKPRIKIIPSSNIARDQTVNVSLRGFVKQEVVRIRWKKGSSWVQIAQVTTSNTGSANINVKVPKFVPDGPTSVRGDGDKGAAAQTNAVTVSGGPFSSSAAKATATPTKTATPRPSPTSIPATATPTSTIAPTQAVALPSATETPTETAIPEPTIAPTETPTLEPTAVPSEPIEPTVTSETG
jgi:hypothetical protein